MNHRYVAFGLMLLSLLAILAGYLLYVRPDMLGLCDLGKQCLSAHTFYGIANPLYVHLRPLPFLFLLLVFVRREAFVAWAWFALVAFPLAIVLIAAAPPLAHDFMPILPDRPQMTALTVRLVCLGSVVVLASTSLRARWKEKR